MPKEKTWKRWEGEGKPHGQGGVSLPESERPEEVEGRLRVMLIQCQVCGAPGLIMRESGWYTCWKCGATVTSE